MRKIQITRFIICIIFWLYLIFLPSYNEMYYLVPYYIIAALMLPVVLFCIIQDKKMDQQFYHRWYKLRKKGLLFNVIRGTILSFIYMTVIICLGRLFGYGQTPFKMISLLGGKMIWIILLLIIFSLITGIILWYENEKRYNKIESHSQE